MPYNNAKYLLSCCFEGDEPLVDVLKKCQPVNRLLDRLRDNPAKIIVKSRIFKYYKTLSQFVKLATT